MKQCPACNRTYTDADLLFCLEDGTQLQSVGFGGSDSPTTLDANANYDPNKTLAFSSPARETSPPPTNVYAPAPVSQPPAQQQWSPSPSYTPPAAAQTARKSGSKGWIIAAIAAVVVLGVGIVVLLAIIGKDSSSANNNNNNQAVVNKNNNSGNTNANTSNRNISVTPSANLLKDDFSTQNWPTGDSAYGSFYEDGEYHMKGKPNLYVYMFPYNSANYMSKNADVKVTARSVDGKSPGFGYGLIMHGKNNTNSKLDGYGFLIYTGSSPKYEIVKFNGGTSTEIVKWEDTTVLRTGTTPNQIEVRAKDAQLSFYINGQFVKSITDTSNITDGYVGLYTTETNEVAFDDMEITR
jgi:hypothetical protein